MRQAFVIVVAVGLAAVAAVLPPPPEVAPPPPVAPVYPGTATSIGYCPTWTADDEVQSDLVLGVLTELDATASFQASDETVVERVRRSGAGTATAAPGLAQGYVPVLAETRAGDPIAAGVVTTGGGIAAASGCARWSANRWTVGIGGTLEGESTTLLLHNPTVQAATVSVSVFSEQGIEIGEGFGSITVPPASLIELEIGNDLRLRERVVFVVDDPVGAVVPALDHRNGSGDRGVTTGVPEAIEWYFPATGGMEAELALVNAESFEVAVEVDVYRTDGVEIGAEQVILGARDVQFLVVPADAALRIRADEPVGAAVRAEAGAGLGLTMGVESEAVAWMLPGIGRDDGERTMSILNTSPEDLPVTYRILGPGGATSGRTITVPGGSVLHQALEISAAAAVYLEAPSPFTVGWRAWIPDGPLMVDQGVPRG
jgi:hypothetical protein